MISYLIISVGFLMFSFYLTFQLKYRFRKYSCISLNIHMTGRDVAEKMLKDNGISGIQIISSHELIPDHYYSFSKTLNLSPGVYSGTHVSAGAIAAHECGHIIQHENTITGTRLQDLSPYINKIWYWLQWIILAGILLIDTFPKLILIGVFILGITTLLSFFSLPLELKASNRAISWLIKSGITSYACVRKAQDAISWTTYTYLVPSRGSFVDILAGILNKVLKRTK